MKENHLFHNMSTQASPSRRNVVPQPVESVEDELCRFVTHQCLSSANYNPSSAATDSAALSHVTLRESFDIYEVM